MIQALEDQFHCRIVQWAEPTDDGLVFSAIQSGRWIVADSPAELVAALCEGDDPVRIPMVA